MTGGRLLLWLSIAILATAGCTPGDPDGETVDGAPDPGPGPALTPEPTDPGGAGTGALSSTAWTALSSAPLALTEVAAAAFGGALWSAGGLDGEGEAVDAVQVYDPTFDLWDAGPPLPEALHHAALVSTGQELLLVGGYVGAGFDNPSAAVHRLDPASGQWQDGPSLPEPRAAGAAAWDGSRVVYAGGVGPDGLADDVFALVGRDWARVAALSQAREHLAATSDGAGRVWLLAGRAGGLEANLGVVDLLEGDAISPIGELPTPRGGVAGFFLPRAGACVAGGEAPDGTFTEVECIDAEGQVATLPPLGQARHGLGAAVVEGIAYAALGGPRPGLSVSAAIEALRVE